MTVGANSYGTVAEVQAFTRMFTSNGAFSTTTRPTLAEVEHFIDSVSSMLNANLAAQGFIIPIIQADALLLVGSISVEYSVELVKAANMTGRFFTEKALEGGRSSLATIRKEILDWVNDNAEGLEALGCEMTFDPSEVGSSDTISTNNDDTGPYFGRNHLGKNIQI